MSTESSAKFYQCMRYPFQVQVHVLESHENLSRHPHRNCLLIHEHVKQTHRVIHMQADASVYIYAPATDCM